MSTHFSSGTSICSKCGHKRHSHWEEIDNQGYTVWSACTADQIPGPLMEHCYDCKCIAFH